MACVQSTRPEDTRAAREEGLTAEDFAEPQAPSRVCLSADAILEVDDRGLTWVPAPEWGGGVFLRRPSGEDRERYERQQKTTKEKKNGKTVEKTEMNLDDLRERLLVDFCCNEDGQLVFACGSKEATRDTVKALKRKSAAVIGRIGDKAIELMGWSATDLDDLVGNSEADQS